MQVAAESLVRFAVDGSAPQVTEVTSAELFKSQCIKKKVISSIFWLLSVPTRFRALCFRRRMDAMRRLWVTCGQFLVPGIDDFAGFVASRG